MPSEQIRAFATDYRVWKAPRSLCLVGNDRIDGGFGQDSLFGGPGNDTIIAADGQEDRVNCGVGTDTAYVDLKDIVDPAQATICENLFVAQK